MEREISAYLSSSAADLRWGLLPERLRNIVGSEAEWLKHLRAHCINVQAAWTTAIGGEEAAYLAEMRAGLAASAVRLIPTFYYGRTDFVLHGGYVRQDIGGSIRHPSPGGLAAVNTGNSGSTTQ